MIFAIVCMIVGYAYVCMYVHDTTTKVQCVFKYAIEIEIQYLDADFKFKSKSKFESIMSAAHYR